MLREAYFEESTEQLSLEDKAADKKIEDRIADLLKLNSTDDKDFNEVNWKIAMEFVVEHSKNDDAAKLYKLLSGGETDTLKKCIEAGPISDGDVPSKDARDKLIDMGMVVKVVSKGEDGFNACNQIAYSFYQLATKDDSKKS